jgi:glycosyltransferase involved in cell wall biosynthesis
MAADKDIQISVVIPCFNEEETVGETIAKAKIGLSKFSLGSEIIIVNNGSTDNSAKIAVSSGARVISESEKGYGYALIRGFDEAKGKYIVMGDADNTYDLSELDKFIRPLMDGHDLVMGSRLKGNIMPGAMKWLHRYIGNPLLSFSMNLLFGTDISDSQCGMRAFTKEAYRQMRLQTGGMELASEMVVNAAKARLKITEVPINYYPRKGKSKLRSFSDGWRHIRFMLLYSPTYLFLLPGEIIFSLGFILMLALLPGPLLIGGHGYDVHVMVLASTLAILGYQIIFLGLYAKIYSLAEGFEEEDKAINLITKYFTLEKGLYAGMALFLAGFGINLYILLKWIAGGFGQLAEVRAALVALTLIVIGIQTIFSSFFISILLIRKAKRK